MASLAIEPEPRMHQSLNADLAPQGIPVLVGGVFCRQSPMVTHRGVHGGACELGDLLVAFSHKPRGAA